MIVISNERITARVSEQIKKTLITAADLTGATLNQFLVQAALENPPEPNAKLLNAVNNYRAHIK